MAFNELRAYRKELYLRTKIEGLRKVYAKAQERLWDTLSRVDVTAFQAYRAKALLREVNQTVAALDGGIYKWAKKTMPEAYMNGLDIAGERLKALRVTPQVYDGARIHRGAVNVLIDQVTIDMIGAHQTISQNGKRFLLMTRQRVMEDAEISRMIAEGVIRGEPRRAVSDRLLGAFRERLGNRQFITIKGRHYQPEKYAELIARTRTREASSQAAVNVALQYDLDLIQIDVHYGACEYCQQYMGRVYSISGSSSDFPMLDEKPPFHPHCQCNPFPITIQSLEERGQYASIVRLSNSPTTKVSSFARFEELIAA